MPLAALAAVGVAVLLAPQRVSHDCALNLQYGQLLLEGKLPYLDFIDTNPPFIMYLSAIPVLAARVLRVGPIPVFGCMVVLLAAWSTVALHGEVAARRAGAARGVVACVWGGYSVYLWVLNEFGQREHLFLLLYVPFLALRWRRWSGMSIAPRRAVFFGVAAGVGVCIKPYFLLIALAPELVFLVAHRQLRRLVAAEVIAAATIGTLYVLHFLLLPEAVWDAFFRHWLPLLVAHYHVYNAPLDEIVDGRVAATLLCALGVFATPRAWRSAFGAFLPALAAATLAAGAVYLGQHKGWYYQSIPMFGGIVLLIASALVVALDAIRARCTDGRWRRVVNGVPLGVAGAMLFTFAISIVPSVVAEARAAVRRDPFVRLIEAYTRESEPVLFASTGVMPAYPTLLQTNRRPATRYLYFAPIALFADDVTSDRTGRRNTSLWRRPRSAEERRFLDNLMADLAASRPPLIFLQATNCQACPPAFSVLRYLRHAGVLAAIVDGYQPLGLVRDCEVFVDPKRLAWPRDRR